MGDADTLMQDRKQYWDEKYRDYWMQRVAETNHAGAATGTSRLNPNDKLTSSDHIYLEAIESLQIPEGATILEMGCGFGRSIPFLRPLSGKLHLIDISEAMVKTATENFAGDRDICFHVCEAEKTPFEKDTFDTIVCFAVFDALYQSMALSEMNRICKAGAQLLLTGKNDNYCDDDEEAYVAEVRAREKGHPNYFTKVADLVKNIDRFGFNIRDARYYERRGDFAGAKFEKVMPEKFYEYQFVLEKTRSVQLPVELSISDAFSATWHRKNQKV